MILSFKLSGGTCWKELAPTPSMFTIAERCSAKYSPRKRYTNCTQKGGREVIMEGVSAGRRTF
jgi:hypothetical protein